MNTLAASRPFAPAGAVPATNPPRGRARGRQPDHRRQALLTARLRVLLIGGVFLLLAVAAIARLAYIGVVQPPGVTSSMVDLLLPPRGEITDRNGVPLARAFPAYALWYNPEALDDGGPPLVKSPEKVAAELKAIFPDMDEAEVARRLAAGKAGYLRRRVLPEDANKVFDIGELALEMPRETDRHYPQGSMAAHILGYVAADGHGRVGMESVLDEQLMDPATRGTAIPLSIDARVQGALEDELARGMKAVNALGAAGIVMDVDTGEVLALASLPTFDPNEIQDTDARFTEEMREKGEFPPMFNRVTNQVYELGSTFKPLTVAAALDAGTITSMQQRWPSGHPLRVGRFSISDSHAMGASLNAAETLMHSSNVVTAQIADEVGSARMKKAMEDLHFNERPYIELPGRGFPIWHSGKWPRLTTMTVGFGHGLAVTPLHLATAYAAMVNGGIWRPATLRKVEPGKAARGSRVFKASTSARMNQLLRLITLNGTGRSADAPGFRVGGKTGSAEKPGVHGYRRSSLVSTFAAAFPMDNPRYVVIAMMDEPKGTAASSYQRTAAWNAAPVVGRLVPRIGPQLGVYPDTTREVAFGELAAELGKEGGE